MLSTLGLVSGIYSKKKSLSQSPHQRDTLQCATPTKKTRVRTDASESVVSSNTTSSDEFTEQYNTPERGSSSSNLSDISGVPLERTQASRRRGAQSTPQSQSSISNLSDISLPSALTEFTQGSKANRMHTPRDTRHSRSTRFRERRRDTQDNSDSEDSDLEGISELIAARRKRLGILIDKHNEYYAPKHFMSRFAPDDKEKYFDVGRSDWGNLMNYLRGFHNRETVLIIKEEDQPVPPGTLLIVKRKDYALYEELENKVIASINGEVKCCLCGASRKGVRDASAFYCPSMERCMTREGEAIMHTIPIMIFIKNGLRTKSEAIENISISLEGGMLDCHRSRIRMKRLLDSD